MGYSQNGHEYWLIVPMLSVSSCIFRVDVATNECHQIADYPKHYISRSSDTVFVSGSNKLHFVASNHRKCVTLDLHTGRWRHDSIRVIDGFQNMTQFGDRFFAVKQGNVHCFEYDTTSAIMTISVSNSRVLKWRREPLLWVESLGALFGDKIGSKTEWCWRPGTGLISDYKHVFKSDMHRRLQQKETDQCLAFGTLVIIAVGDKYCDGEGGI